MKHFYKSVQGGGLPKELPFVKMLETAASRIYHQRPIECPKRRVLHARYGPRYHLIDNVGYKSGDGLGVGVHGVRVPIMPRWHVTRLGNGARRHALSQVRDLNDGGCRS